ncbi:hypothetical protein GCM10007190_15350 [Macrococcus hajekii]|nr:hypothetical protein GCM10007190_15350 [Macrococcus hajekii]
MGIMGEKSVLPFIVIILIRTVSAQIVRALNRKRFTDILE